MAKTLKQKLIQNRSVQGTGSGEQYWESVVKIINEHYAPLLNPKQPEVKEVVRMDWVLDLRTPEDGFKDDLEDVLDEHFPKGQCKHRGPALVLFAFANILFAKHLKRALKKHE